MDITTYLEGRLNPEPPLPSLKQANALYADVRAALGMSRTAGTWFTDPTSNLKFSNTPVLPTWGWSALPNTLSGLSINMCGNNSPACTASCLNTAGHGPIYTVQRGRLARTLMMIHHPEASATLFKHHLQRIVRRTPQIAFRPNVLTDIIWEKVWPELFDQFPSVRFYDYTKHWDRPVNPAKNYYLTFSASEFHTLDEIRHKVLELRHNVAVVVDYPLDHHKPKRWAGMPTIDGDSKYTGDARYNDRKGRVVLLSAKGKAKRAAYRRAGFVRPIDME